MTRSRTFAVVCLLGLCVTTGCDDSDESDGAVATTDSATSTPVSQPTTSVEEVVRTIPFDAEATELGPLGSTELDLETDDGQVQIGDAQVPDIVPSDFPIPDDFVTQLSTGIEGSAGFSGVSQQTFGDLVELYTTGLSGAGYTTTQDQFVADVLAVISFDGPNGQGQVAISSAPGGTGRSVIVTFER